MAALPRARLSAPGLKDKLQHEQPGADPKYSVEPERHRLAQRADRREECAADDEVGQSVERRGDMRSTAPRSMSHGDLSFI